MSIATRLKRASCPAMSSIGASAVRTMPSRPRQASNVPRWACQRLSGTRRAASGSGSGSGPGPPSAPASSLCQLFSTIRPFLMSVAIDCLLESFRAEAAHGVDETLRFAVANVQVPADEPLDDIGNLGRGERAAEHFAERRVLALRAADLDLIPLLTVLVDAEDAYVADVVVAAGVHATRNIEVELADVEQIVEVLETGADRLRDRNRLGVGQRTEVAPRAADDVGEQPDVRRRHAEPAQLQPQVVQPGGRHAGK